MTTMTVNGRIGRDAEVRHTANGSAVCNIALAYNYGQKDDQGSRPTQWVEAAMWGKQAESLEPYLTKGACVSAVIRDVHIETYDGKSGVGHKLVGTIVHFDFLPQQKTDGQQEPPKQSKPKSAPSQPPAPNDLDDDIPF